MIVLLLALAAPRVPDVPELPAPLAWLEDRADEPAVSRRLMLLEPLLCSADAQDGPHQSRPRLETVGEVAVWTLAVDSGADPLCKALLVRVDVP